MKRKMSRLMSLTLVVALCLCSMLCFTIPSAAANPTVLYDADVNLLFTGANGGANHDTAAPGVGDGEYYYSVPDAGFSTALQNDVATYGVGSQYVIEVTMDVTAGSGYTFIPSIKGSTKYAWGDTTGTYTASGTGSKTFVGTVLQSKINDAGTSSLAFGVVGYKATGLTGTITHLKLSVAEDRPTGTTTTWHANANGTGYVESPQNGTYDCLRTTQSSALRVRQYSAEVSKRATVEDIRGYVDSATTVDKTMMEFIIANGDLAAGDYIEYVWDWTTDGYTATPGTCALTILAQTGYLKNSVAVGPSTSGVTFTVTAHTATLRIDGPLTVNSSDTSFEMETTDSIGIWNKVMNSATLAVTIHSGGSESSVESSAESSVESSAESSTPGGAGGLKTSWHANAEGTGYAGYVHVGNKKDLSIRQYSSSYESTRGGKGWIDDNTAVNKTLLQFIVGYGDLTADEYIVYTWTATDAAFGTSATLTKLQQSGYDGVTAADATCTVTDTTVSIRLDGPLTVKSSDESFYALISGVANGYNVDYNATLTVSIYGADTTPSDSKAAVTVNLNDTATDIDDVVTGATGVALSSDGGSSYVEMTKDATGIYSANTLKADTAYSVYATVGSAYTQIGTGTVTSVAAAETPTPLELNYYTITAAAATGEEAKFASVTGTGNYLSGTTATLTATTVSGKAFSEWKLNDTQVSTSATYEVTVSAQATYTAYAVTAGQAIVNVNKNGTATAIDSLVSGATGLALSADSGVSFINMSNTETGVYTANTLIIGTTYTVYANGTSLGKAVTAISGDDTATPLVVDYYTVTLTGGSGISAVSVNGTPVTSGIENVYMGGTTITLGATAATGKYFGSWAATEGGALVSTVNAYAFTLTEAVALTACSNDFDPEGGGGGGDTLVKTWVANSSGHVSYAYMHKDGYFLINHYKTNAGYYSNDSTTNKTPTNVGTDFVVGENDYLLYTITYTGSTYSNIWSGVTGAKSNTNDMYQKTEYTDYEIVEQSDSTKLVLKLSGPLTANSSKDGINLKVASTLPAKNIDISSDIQLTVEYHTASAGSKNSVTIATSDTIGVKFNLDVSEAAGGSIDLVYNQHVSSYDTNRQTTTYQVATLVPVDDVVSLSISMLPAQICDPIDIIVKNSDGEAVFTRYNFTIKQYCDYQIAESEDDDPLNTLCKAIVNYGAASQVYFNYNTANMATAGGDYGTLSAVSATYASGSIIKGTNVQSLSATMVAGADSVALRFNFTLKNNEKLSDSTYSNTGVGTASYGSGVGREYIAVTGITPTQFSENVALTVEGEDTTTIHYSVYNFAYAKSTKGDAATSNFGKALYAYGEAAKAYFGA